LGPEASGRSALVQPAEDATLEPSSSTAWRARSHGVAPVRRDPRAVADSEVTGTCDLGEAAKSPAAGPLIADPVCC